MNLEARFSQLLSWSLLILCFSGFFARGLTRRFPKQIPWVLGAAWLAFFSIFVWSTSEFARSSAQPLIWSKGWILPHSQLGAVLVGAMQDGSGSLMILLVGLLSLGLVLDRGFFSRTDRGLIFASSTWISLAGVILSWISLTPWLTILGMGVASLGGLLGLDGSPAVIRLAWEKLSGVMLCLLGACVLAGARMGLRWDAMPLWIHPAATSGADILGCALLLVGAWFQLQPFPIIGGLNSYLKISSDRVEWFAQVLPALSTFALLVRLEAQIQKSEVFAIFGWVTLASAFFSALSGLMLLEWRKVLRAALVSSWGLAACALVFSDVRGALSILIAASVGSLALMVIGERLKKEGISGKGFKLIVFVAVAAWIGVIGFLPARSWLLIFMKVQEHPAYTIILGFVFFIQALLLWKLAFMLSKALRSQSAGTSASSFPALAVLFAAMGLGMVWDGSFSGGLLPAGMDGVLPSLMGAIFQGTLPFQIDDAPYISALTISCAIPLLALLLAALSMRGETDFWSRTTLSGMPRFSSWMSGGYGVDRFHHALGRRLWRLGHWIDQGFDRWIWDRGLPWVSRVGLHRTSQAINQVDERFSQGLRVVCRQALEWPSSFLLWVQGNDVRWYLVGVAGSVLILLFYFLKT